jgi:hypothetical protein
LSFILKSISNLQQNFNAGVGLSVENFERIFQNFEMKGRSQKLSAVSPLLVSAQQKSGAEPGFEVQVLVGLRDEAVAAQYGLGVFGVIKPNLRKLV